VAISAWLQSLEQTGLASGIRNSLYVFPILEAIHVMALSVVFGTIVIVDLRILGLASTERPFGRMSSELLKFTWGAFAVAALTGTLMFMTNARVYAANTPFRIKMALLALAGLNMALFHLTAGKSAPRWEKGPTAPALGKVTATASVTLWIAIIFAGRVIGFTTRGAQAQEAVPPATNFDDFLTAGPETPAPAPAAAPAAAPSLAARTTGSPANGSDTASYSIRTIMAALVDPSGDFLFESVADIADAHGVTHKAPRTPEEWSAVRHHLQVLVDAQKLLIVPGRRAAEPGDRSADPAVENEPEQVQKLLDSQHPDFVRRAQRLGDAAALGLKAVDAHDTKALFRAITSIDKACESCHLHYWYPNDKRARQAAQEEGGIIE
jgi:cytochrome c556